MIVTITKSCRKKFLRFRAVLFQQIPKLRLLNQTLCRVLNLGDSICFQSLNHYEKKLKKSGIFNHIT